ncbi:hypothetical protein DQ04_02151060 [Trypanosoma grayi]|uniref:hypothetical protein n=1 Tax=Trypanosoma grayi TaxID=71804 RepID=UPI0004F47832|nr:hypothetical protein DQ04_02151060 [Trypanosoma grayi]KEG11917.1 hypothetical protein DQ04_02151060 [Trypanosoma grayi]
MTSHHSVAAVTEIRLEVTHARQKLLLVFPAATATVGDLKKELAARSGVPQEKQRLLFGAPVVKHRRREGRDEVRLLDLISNTHATSTSSNGGGGAAVPSVSSSSAIDSPAAAAVTIPLMLIGTVASVPYINEKAVAQLHRLVTTTVERDNRSFRCSYSHGYVPQTAFVCRTCVRNGWANPAHAFCYACAEVCHGNHDVEEWGVRNYMRCDCCTVACWQNVSDANNKTSNNHAPNDESRQSEETSDQQQQQKQEQEPRHCCFVIDSETGQPPATSVVPLNSKNRYPRALRKWCYCDSEDDHPVDDTTCGGIVCMLCATCYWSTHMTRLHTDAFRRMPCYGDVEEGDAVVFRCRTCETLVCTPCRLRCHKDHEVDPDAVLASRARGTENGASAGVEFSCGCGGCCAIAETVPEAELSDATRYLPMPPAVAVEAMNSDSFVGFICAHCMQEHPWLLENDPRQCYGGQLPEKVPAEQHKRIVPCGLAADAGVPDDVYPFHGMLFPVDAFTVEMTCPCKPCQEAYERFAPRNTAGAVTEMVVQLHDKCDHCGHIIRDEEAFLCQTCELHSNEAFLVCQRCNSLRLACVLPPLGGTPACVVESTGTVTSAEAGHGGGNGGADTVQTTEAVAPWKHPISHTFVEDTFENLYSLCGMQIMQGLDSASREYVMENIDATSASLDGALRRTFLGEPLVFDPDEVAQHHQWLLTQQNGKKKEEAGDTSASARKQQRDDTDKNGLSGGEERYEKRKKSE